MGDAVAFGDSPGCEGVGDVPDPLIDLGSGDRMPGAGCVLGEDGAVAVGCGGNEEDIVESLEIQHGGSTLSDAARRCKPVPLPLPPPLICNSFIPCNLDTKLFATHRFQMSYGYLTENKGATGDSSKKKDLSALH